MTAAYQDLYIEQNADYQMTFNVTNPNNIALNLNGYTCYSSIKNSYYNSNVVVNFTATIYDANNGGIELSLTNQQTANIAPGRYVYDTILVNPVYTDNVITSNVVTRVLEGLVDVLPGVTII